MRRINSSGEGKKKLRVKDWVEIGKTKLFALVLLQGAGEG